ncbi:hypothetical protein FMEAI12_5360011 [Parafrankia sp. Ea1.12]|nr:hypothetical protein FMEAI12_5360011 [Parafrankia sp. Ea1.12]
MTGSCLCSVSPSWPAGPSSSGWTWPTSPQSPRGWRSRCARRRRTGTAPGRLCRCPTGRTRRCAPCGCTGCGRRCSPSTGVTGGPLLCRVDRHGNIGGRLTGDGVRRILQTLGVRAGLPAGQIPTPHGLRAGGATAAARAGPRCPRLPGRAGGRRGPRWCTPTSGPSTSGGSTRCAACSDPHSNAPAVWRGGIRVSGVPGGSRGYGPPRNAAMPFG